MSSSRFASCCLGVREGLAWRGKGSGGGPRASVPGGVGGRGTDPKRSKFSQRVSYFCRLQGCPTGAGLVDGGVDQGPWLQERVGGGVGAGWQFQRRGGLGLGCCSKKKQVQGRVGLLGSSTGGGKGSGGNPSASVLEG